MGDSNPARAQSSSLQQVDRQRRASSKRVEDRLSSIARYANAIGEQMDEDQDASIQSGIGMSKTDATESEDNIDMSPDRSSSSSGSDHWVDPTTYQSPPAEYWHVQKIVKFIKAGNKTATSVAMACLIDYNLNDEFNKLAIRDIGGLEILINLLETKDYKCTVGALNILGIISDHQAICRDITNLGAIPILIHLLNRNSTTIQNKAAYMISILAKLKRTRSQVYNYGGVPPLINLLDIDESLLMTPLEHLTKENKDIVRSCSASAKALFSLSRSKKIKVSLIKGGILKMISKLMHSVHDDIVLYTMGFFQNCATEGKCQLAIETEDIIDGILQHLHSNTAELRELCSQALFKSCAKEGPRKLVFVHGGCSLLITLLKDAETEKHVPLLTAVTGAIWKCSLYNQNLLQLDGLDATKLLIRFVRHEDEEVLVNVVGGLSELAKIAKNRETIYREGAIKILVAYLKYTNNKLLENVCSVLGECAKNSDGIRELDELDAIRFIWSLLKNPDRHVQTHAAFALVPCIENADDAGEMIRSFVGGLELLVTRVKSRHPEVVAAVCAAIAIVAKDKENLAVISDHGVMPLLSNHIHTKNALLRQHLASAIAACCGWKDNCHMFGQYGICPYIADYIKTDNEDVKVTAAQALCALSHDPINCISLHRNGAVPYLLDSVSSENKDLQLAAAGCLSNIRRLVLEAGKLKYGPRKHYKLVRPVTKSNTTVTATASKTSKSTGCICPT